MLELLNFISGLITLYIYIIIAGAVMSWLIAFNVVNPYNQFVRSLWQALNAVTEPLLRPIRRLMPDLGGIDISPVILIICCWFIQGVLASGPGEADRLTPVPTAPARSVASRQRTAAEGLRIRVHASPKSSRDGVDGHQRDGGWRGAEGARARRGRGRGGEPRGCRGGGGMAGHSEVACRGDGRHQVSVQDARRCG